MSITATCIVCGRTTTARRGSHADVYWCGRRDCEKEIPAPLAPNTIMLVEMNAVGSFWGYTYRIATPEERAGVERAKALLRDAQEYRK